MAYNGYSYGQTSEKTKRVRDALVRVSDFGHSDSVDAETARGLANELAGEFGDIGDVFVEAAIDLLGAISADGKVDDGERELLDNLVETFDRPVSDEPVTEVAGKRIVLTGDFSLEGGKATAKEMIATAGGRVTGSVSGRTDYVVVGDKGNSAWAFGNFGSKVKKAIDLKLQGSQKISIVSEGALLAYFEGNSEEAMEVLEGKSRRFREQWEGARTVSQDFSGLTEGQQKVLDLVKQGRNVYLTGLGGTGKSYVLERVIEWSRASGKNVIVCAPTGIAALNVGGSTLHRALGIGPSKTLQQNPYPFIRDGSPLPDCDLMIVDEISMCRLDLFDYLSSVLRKAATMRAKQGRPCCQLVVVGDFCQLPPVIPPAEEPILAQKYGRPVGKGYPFMGTEWETWRFERVELTEAIRQRDARFVAALNACRVGDMSGVRWIEAHAARTPAEHAIVLCGTNRQADGENARRLRALKTPEATYGATVQGEVTDKDMPTSRRLTLRPGARVMALVNDSETTYMNGTLGTVVRCRPGSVSVDFDGLGVAEVPSHRWEVTVPSLVEGRTKNETIGTFEQIPLKLAWAITIHKSQGQTFDSAYVYPDCWEEGQLYTALSRLTSVDGLCLAHAINDDCLRTSQDVLKFLDGEWSTPAPAPPQAEAAHAATGPEERVETDGASDTAGEPTLRSLGLTASAGLLVLERAGITTPRDLVGLGEDDLLRVFGPGKLDALLAFLSGQGLLPSGEGLPLREGSLDRPGTAQESGPGNA